MKLQYAYYVYILLCADGSYYTGVTNDIDRRLEEHNQGFDTKCYTFLRRPVELKYFEHSQQVDDAIRREKQIKRWTKKKKEALICGDKERRITLSKNAANKG